MAYNLTYESALKRAEKLAKKHNAKVVLLHHENTDRANPIAYTSIKVVIPPNLKGMEVHGKDYLAKLRQYPKILADYWPKISRTVGKYQERLYVKE